MNQYDNFGTYDQPNFNKDAGFTQPFEEKYGYQSTKISPIDEVLNPPMFLNQGKFLGRTNSRNTGSLPDLNKNRNLDINLPPKYRLPKVPKYFESDPFSDLLNSMNPKNPANAYNSRMALKLSRMKERNKALK